LEELTTLESMGVREALTEAAAAELDLRAFRTIATLTFSEERGVDELRSILEDWDSITGELGPKQLAGVLQGYGLYLLGRLDEAETLLESHKRHEWGAYWLVQTLLSKNQLEKALQVAEDAREKQSDFRPIAYVLSELLVRSGRVEEAGKLLEKLKKGDKDSSIHASHFGFYQERMGEYAAAIESYRHAVERDRSNADALFRLGYALDIYGDESDEANEEAIAAYESCVKLEPVHTNAVINLGILYEDRERHHDAIKCYETVLRRFPNHERARLYLGDAHASTRMFYDKDQEKKADRHSQVLKIPVSDFELSVRSRNCLQKMNIETLGDLIMKTEQELLSYKNFGETSLGEIKQMLSQKGLRLGQGLETKGGEVSSGRNPLEATASPDVLNRSIDEVELSVRSRRCMERLEVRTIRDLINKTEVELMAAKNFGMTSLNEIKRKLAEIGLGLRP